MDIQAGTTVRIYYDSDTFDEGEVIVNDQPYIVVDFYDWVERWPNLDAFEILLPYLECKVILMPKTRGDIIIDYQQSVNPSAL